MQYRTAMIVTFLAAGTLGCPERGPVDGDNNGNFVEPDMGGDSGSAGRDDAGTSENGEAGAMTAAFVATDWGLFRESPGGEVSDELVVVGDDHWKGEVFIPTGVVTLRLELDGEEVLYPDAMVDGAGSLDGLESGPGFNPIGGIFEFEVRRDGNDYDVEVTRAESEAWSVDAVDAPTTLGPWWDDLFASFSQTDDPGAVTVELMDELRRRGGPLHTDEGVLFIAPAQDGETPPQIRGSWTNWEATAETELRRVRQGLWARYIETPAGKQQYKIVYGDGETWVTDISNPHIEWDGINPGTVGEFNSIVNPVEDSSRLVWLRQVESSQLGNNRDVYVQLPSGYDTATADYPVLYFHDGNESIVRGQFHEVAAQTAQSNPQTATINVFVALPTQDIRIDEYTMGTDGSRGDAYVDFLADTLVPMVDDRFRTRTEKAARGLAGASLGGLISFWGAMQHADVFGYAAGMSSSFFWGDNFMIGEIGNRGCQGVSYYLDSGSPNDNYQVTLTMRDQLDTLGCDYDYVLDEGGQHEWSYWNARLDGVMVDFAGVHSP